MRGRFPLYYQELFLIRSSIIKILIIQGSLKAFLDNPAESIHANVDPGSLKHVARIVYHWVYKRILFEDLTRNKILSTIELYRLFAASQEDLRFRSLSDIIRAVVLYGDVLSYWKDMDLHPMTKDLLIQLTRVSRPAIEELKVCRSDRILKVGILWVRMLCTVLVPYLPVEKKKSEKTDIATPQINPDKKPPASNGTKESYRFNEPSAAIKDDADLAPLEGPLPPMLDEPAHPELRDTIRSLVQDQDDKSNSLKNNAVVDALSESAKETLQTFGKSIEMAGGQANKWEDMRSDLLEKALSKDAFMAGPIEGTPVGGHEVTVNFGGEQKNTGELFDRPIELSEDLPACELLAQRAQPITRELEKNLYPNLQEKVQLLRFRTNGSLDPARLACGYFSSAIFRSYPVREIADQRGRPVLVIACDGSGSLNSKQMQMVKLLSASYLGATRKTDLKLLAALYHSGTIREGVSGPLVRWIYHPKKSSSTSVRQQALRAVASLPDSGTGVQADALSLSFILDEAKQLARGKMIYLILISDTAWNRSFRTSLSGQEEVYTFFKNSYTEMQDRLNTTLVALGVEAETGFEDLLDTVIPVCSSELDNPELVAKKIGVYVASCIRERKRLCARSEQ